MIIWFSSAYQNETFIKTEEEEVEVDMKNQLQMEQSAFITFKYCQEKSWTNKGDQ